MGLSQAYHQNEEEEMTEPVSPTGQYFNSSVLSVCVIGVLESQVPIDDTPTMTLLRDVFLPISPRFSSIMVCDENGDKQWKRVDVKLKNHVKIPTFPNGLTPSSYDTYFNNYISKIAMQQLPKTQPLWEIHIIKYPTINAAGNLIFKLHHALGDGFSLMGALLSCLQRADNPSLPLTFPSLRDSNSKLSHTTGGESYTKKDPRMLLTRIFGSVFNSMLDFGWSLVKSSLLEDDKSPIRSGGDAVEFKPIDVSTLTFSLDHIKQIKSRVGVSINDVITGMIFHGIRLYMQGIDKDSTNTQSTALVLLNTRVVGGYKSVQEMVKPNAESPWGNQFGFLHVSLPDLAAAADHGSSNPLEFVYKAQQIIQSKRNSLGVFLTGRLLEASRKLRGPETTAKYIYSTLKNSSMTISNVIGPVEQMSLADHPIKGLYFMVVGVPQSLTITVLSYTGQLRIAVGTEKDFIDSEKFKSCIETAFDILFKYST